MSKKKNKTVLVISDTQAPFHHKDCLPFLAAVKKKYKPTRVVHIGDYVDFYCLSDYLKSPDAISPTDELAKVKKFTKDLAKMFPTMDIIWGNHCERLLRAAKRAGIPAQLIRGIEEIIGAPKGWKYHHELEIDNVLYQHGHETGAGGQVAAQRRAVLNGKSTVAGHLHTNASIMYFANRSQLIWGLHVGSLIDHKAIAFEYSRKALRKPILSVGMVVDGVPMILPMHLDDDGNWNGKV